MVKEKIDTKFVCEWCGESYNIKENAINCEKQHKKEADFDNINEFELKQEHINLLKETWINWEDCEFGAPAIDCKRPYGNSSVEDDIAEIIKLPKKGNWDYKEECWKESATEKLNDLHKETQIALQIILHCQTFKLGIYKKDDKYEQEWTYLGESSHNSS